MEAIIEQCICSAGQRRSEWCEWIAGGVFLQPHPPYSSEVAAPLDSKTKLQMLDVVEVSTQREETKSEMIAYRISVIMHAVSIVFIKWQIKRRKTT